VPAPPVRLGATTLDGIAPAFYALLARGVEQRPEIAARVRGRIEIRPEEAIDPIRIEFTDLGVLVEDGSWDIPDVLIEGRLPDIVHLTVAPNLAGIPNPAVRAGRTAFGHITRRRVRITGRRQLGRRMLQLMHVGPG
jgi:hypothetical protein